MAGYADDYSKSYNAIEAEMGGKYPLSKAIKVVAKEAGISQKLARLVLEHIGSHEYHHISKKYNSVSYYDTNDALEFIREDPEGFRDLIEGDKRQYSFEFVSGNGDVINISESSEERARKWFNEFYSNRGISNYRIEKVTFHNGRDWEEVFDWPK